MEYLMCNTYDVHFYASFALTMLWPEIQKSIQLDICESIPVSTEDEHNYLMHGKKGPVKTRNAVPHDIGSPARNPWAEVNSYAIHMDPSDSLDDGSMSGKRIFLTVMLKSWNLSVHWEHVNFEIRDYASPNCFM
eukprot:gene25496-biopygen10649